MQQQKQQQQQEKKKQKKQLLANISLLCSFLLLQSFASSKSVRATKFDFATLTLGDLKLLGDAHLKNGSIRLTRDLPVPTSGAGRALFADAVPLRHPSSRLPLPFSTSFAFSVSLLNPSSSGGGLAFLLSPDDHSLGDSGPFLGLLNSSSSPASSAVAVEFDTFMDVAFDDINGNHLGIDVGSVVSAAVADLDLAGVDLKSGELISAWIDYTELGVLRVFVSYAAAARPAEPVLEFPVDLAQFPHDAAFVGFSASTQGSTEIHSIEWWSFSSSSPNPAPAAASTPPPTTNPVVTSSPPPPSIAPTVSTGAAESPGSNASRDPPPSSSSACRSNGLCRQGPAAVAGVATAGAFVLASFAGLAFWVFARKARSSSPQKWGEIAAASEIAKAPREFTYRELCVATRDFDSSRIIGHGAFGTVYKGIVMETGAMVAVKRCIRNHRGGGGAAGAAEARAEFLSELSIIAGLRHRNLVRLIGWCREKGEILLVYDYMLHGSLDKALFDPGAPPLPWRTRREILVGVASALAYLHWECERQVIHRDVKSSNVMLGEGYHARLGDFGLARQADHGGGTASSSSPGAGTAAAAGTMGYLAPEYLLTGRATAEADVFSFGALVLEVACGRRPIDSVGVVGGGGGARRLSNLVEWVWGLHGEGRMLEAVDVRIMEGEYEEGEMRGVLLVGLACSSPDPVVRPGMRSVVQMLSGEAEAPFVPETKPSMSFMSANRHLLLSLQDSVSDYNALGLNLSGSSDSSSSSLRSTLRGGGGGGTGG